MANKRYMDTITEVASEKQVATYYECVEVNLETSQYLLTNAPFDVAYDGKTYRAWGALLGFNDVEETATMEIGQLSITVSGIASWEDGTTPITDILAEDYTHAPVFIHRVYYGENGLIGGFEVYHGYINAASVQFSNGDQSSVNIQTSNHLSDFKRQAGRFTNTESQQFYYPDDEGFEYSTEVQKEIKWAPPA